MNNKKRSVLRNLDPSKIKIGNKIHLLLISLVLLTILIMVFFGFIMLYSTLVKNTSSHLNEISHLKVTEIEISIKSIDERLFEFVGQETVRHAAEEFTTAFRELGNEVTDLPEMDQIKRDLSDFYVNEIAPLAPFSGDNILNYFSKQDVSLIAQYLYIYLNPKPLGEKDKFIFANDYSSYSHSHGSYHTFFENFRSKIGAKDLLLVDPGSGDIVYTVNKSIDFGTNLYDGPFKNEPISMAFRKAVASSTSKSYFVDYAQYTPSMDEPVAFLSIPLIFFDELTTVIILEFGSELLDNILFDEYTLTRENSLTYDIIGEDLKLRNNPEDFIKDSEEYLDRIKRKASKKELNDLIRFEKTGALSLYTHYNPKYRDILTIDGNIELQDYMSRRVLASVSSIDFLGANYSLITKIDRSEALLNFVGQMKIFAVLILLLLILVFVIGRVFGKALTQRISSLLAALNQLYSGEKSRNIRTGPPDEIGKTIDAFNQLQKRINNAEEFALELSEGNFNYKFDILSDRDSLGKSLNVLKDRLITSRDEEDARKNDDEIRNWINTGIAKFNDLLRKNNDDIKALSYSIIKSMVDYLNANQGGVFLVEGESEKEKKIELIASYAYNREKYHRKSLEINEGLLGSIYMEKKPIYLKNIPDDYIEITSGLGQATPRVLYIVPLKVDENVLGMIEVASFSEFESHYIEFIDKVSESIAATFVSVRLNMKTAVLLEESNRRAEEIAQQEEEMRQNLEEMQATQEELARLRQDDEKRTREMQLIVDNTRNLLKNLTNATPGGYTLKDSNGILHFANEEGAEYYGAPVDKILGKTDHELLDSATYKTEHKSDESVLKDGDKEYSEERRIKGKIIKYQVIKKQFQIEEIHQTGVLTIRIKL
jgi:PAS domain-containing protein/HAMP domain-containing protein